MAGPNPCKSEEEAYANAVAAQRKTQRELDWVNNAKNEAAAAKFGKDRREYKEWQESVKKAMDANNKAVNRVNETFKELERCREKAAAVADARRGQTGGGQSR